MEVTTFARPWVPTCASAINKAWGINKFSLYFHDYHPFLHVKVTSAQFFGHNVKLKREVGVCNVTSHVDSIMRKTQEVKHCMIQQQSFLLISNLEFHLPLKYTPHLAPICNIKLFYFPFSHLASLWISVQHMWSYKAFRLYILETFLSSIFVLI